MAADTLCTPLTEADLQRACSGLYASISLEAVCGVVMCVYFGCTTIMYHYSLKNFPALAFFRCCRGHVKSFMVEFLGTMMTVCAMPTMSLEVRLRCCSNIDKMVNSIAAVTSLLFTTRWLSLGNVNGMRYLGYAMTCPLSQLELLVMIAPVLPCYRFLAFISFSVPILTISAGYAAALLGMPLWDGEVLAFFSTWNLDDLQPTIKLWVSLPAFIGVFLNVIVILPFLVLLWRRKGGDSNKSLPQGFRSLVFIVWASWLFVPIWWCLSWEGMEVITNTAIGELGFAVLWIASRGLFSEYSMWQRQVHDNRLKELRNIKIYLSTGSNSVTTLEEGRMEASPCEVPPVVSRVSSRHLSASMFIQMLRQFDERDDETVSESEAGSESESELEEGDNVVQV